MGYLRLAGAFGLAVAVACTVGTCLLLAYRAADRAFADAPLLETLASTLWPERAEALTLSGVASAAAGSADSSAGQPAADASAAASDATQPAASADTGAAQAPDAVAPSSTADAPASARTVRIDYTSMAATGTVSTEVTWDDAWFFQDPSTYNHELATTCSVLAALANSESGYYQAGSDSPAYVEDALGALGFTDVDTSSYVERSEVIDQMLDFVTQANDVAAYASARKTVRSADGAERTLLLVTIRGSYGAEWLSNLNMEGTLGGARASDHAGYARAAREIYDHVATQMAQEQAAGRSVSVLLCGHSRGGALAGMVAAWLTDRLNIPAGTQTFSAADGAQAVHASAQVPGASVYAYTFASPAVTTHEDADAPRYTHIFNIVNPSDPMPRLPLASWGYRRYGRTIELPGAGDDGFDRAHATMCEKFTANVGVASPYDPEDRTVVDSLIDRLEGRFASPSAVATPEGAVEIVRMLATEVDVQSLLYSHYPDTYIAWMQALRPASAT